VHRFGRLVSLRNESLPFQRGIAMFSRPVKAYRGKKAAKCPGYRHQLSLEALDYRLALATAYLATDLVSDQPGIAAIQDPNLVNAWGLSLSPTAGNFWVSSAEAGLSMVYGGDVNGAPLTKSPLEVSIPEGEPTGQVFNGTSDFVVTSGSDSAPALFIFASEEGVVSGWNPAVPLPPPSTEAQGAFEAEDGAIYTGIALANNGDGNFLYLADFHNGKIDVLDGSYQLTEMAGSFTDPNLPAGYAPFNVAAISGKLYVTYALQDADAEDEVTGPGRGFIDVFDLDGNFQQRLVSRGALNAPWGMVLAPAGFGDFSGQLLVGNFGDGRINAFDPTTGALKGTLSSSPGRPLSINGLWGLAFGNGATAGDATTLYYSAGPQDEEHGLFGKITANAAGTNPVQATLTDGDLVITGSRDSDVISVNLDFRGQQILVRAGTRQIGSFPVDSVTTIEVNGFAGNDRIIVSPRVTTPTIIDGGAGNDFLTGGGGSGILEGNAGNDIILGGNARDVLIGGTGRDTILGGGGDDLVITGSTTYDDDTTALMQILTAWKSTDNYATRLSNLRTGADGVPILDASTVTDDGTLDIALGAAGQDWFFAATRDFLPGKTSGEETN
jgi:uncharacterized protein (TIGR03118 family)